MADLTQFKERIIDQTYTRITRVKGEFADFARGYVIDVSERIALIQTTSDFDVDGFILCPVETLKLDEPSEGDVYYDQIMVWESKKNPVCRYQINLESWPAAFESLKTNSLAVIIECEEPHLDFFCIGFVDSVDDEGVFVYYFSPDGYLDKDLTFVAFRDNTKVSFADRYSSVLSKYVRKS